MIKDSKTISFGAVYAVATCPHDLLAMGEEKLTANMGAESIMDTVTGEQRVQPVRGARGPVTTRRAHPQTC